MTNEELERMVALLIEGQQQTQALLAELARRDDEQMRRDADKEERIARFERSYVAIADLLQQHAARISTLEESRDLLVQLARNSDERLDHADEHDARLEEAFQTIADIAARQDERIRALEGKS